MRLERQTDARMVNEFLNHPAIFPWVSGGRPAPLDAAPIIADSAHVVLCCTWGGIIFVKLAVGYYEAHTCVLPDGRGRGTLELGRSALLWLFSSTDAIEILTRVPHGNVAGASAMRALGVPVWFTTGAIWPMPGGKVPMDVYKLHVFDWIRMEMQLLSEAGQEFHHRLHAAGGIVNHDTDLQHDAYVGAAMKMIEGGQADKAVSVYNLWAAMSGYHPISIASRDPLLIDIGDGVVAPQTGEFRPRHAA